MNQPGVAHPALLLLLVLSISIFSSRVMAQAVDAESGPTGVEASEVEQQAIEREFELHPDQSQFVNIVLVESIGGEGRERTIASRQAALLEALGSSFMIAYRYRHVPALSGFVDRHGWANLKRSPWVRAVGRDQRSRAELGSSVPFVQADQVHDLGFTGAGITVAVVDSGIDTDHPDLADNIAPGAWHFLDQGFDQGPGAEDVRGHGTSVSGVITSAGNVASVGVAPDADILAVEVLDAFGEG